MKRIGKKVRPDYNPKRIVKPIELPDVFKPKEKPNEVGVPNYEPAIPLQQPGETQWRSPDR
jgi:hypothetical protein